MIIKMIRLSLKYWVSDKYDLNYYENEESVNFITLRSIPDSIDSFEAV